MRRFTSKVVLGLALAALILPAAGCRKGRGGYTNVDVGFGGFGDYVSGFMSGGGYEEVFYDEEYFESGPVFDDGGYYEEGYYPDDWKGKKAGRGK